MGQPINRSEWRRELRPLLAPSAVRSTGQIASCVVPYLGVWIAAWAPGPLPTYAYVLLGLVATVFLTRMYSLFHDLTHGALYPRRPANRRAGRLLGVFLFTPFAWWQRQHNLHHAHTGDLDQQGPGEIRTMTLADYVKASKLERLTYRAYRNPMLLLLVGPTLVFLFERQFPQRGMTRSMLFDVLFTNALLVAWIAFWMSVLGVGPFLLLQGTTLIAGGAIAAWMLYIQHQYEQTYYARSDAWNFEAAALQGSSFLKLPRIGCWIVGNANYHHVHHLSARIPNYHLREAHETLAVFRQTPVVTLGTSWRCFALKLWDEHEGRMVPLSAARTVRT